jgi:hypothetical protein
MRGSALRLRQNDHHLFKMESDCNRCVIFVFTFSLGNARIQRKKKKSHRISGSDCAGEPVPRHQLLETGSEDSSKKQYTFFGEPAHMLKNVRLS